MQTKNKTKNSFEISKEIYIPTEKDNKLFKLILTLYINRMHYQEIVNALDNKTTQTF